MMARTNDDDAATTTKSRDIGRDDRYNTRGDAIRYDTTTINDNRNRNRNRNTNPIRTTTTTPMATAILVPILPYNTN